MIINLVENADVARLTSRRDRLRSGLPPSSVHPSAIKRELRVLPEENMEDWLEISRLFDEDIDQMDTDAERVDLRRRLAEHRANVAQKEMETKQEEKEQPPMEDDTVLPKAKAVGNLAEAKTGITNEADDHDPRERDWHERPFSRATTAVDSSMGVRSRAIPLPKLGSGEAEPDLNPEKKHAGDVAVMKSNNTTPGDRVEIHPDPQDIVPLPAVALPTPAVPQEEVIATPTANVPADDTDHQTFLVDNANRRDTKSVRFHSCFLTDPVLCQLANIR